MNESVVGKEPDILGWKLYGPGESGIALQQGDLIRFGREDEGFSYGIVVTADCDLDKRKHSRLVTLAPLIAASNLISRALAFDLLEKKHSELCRKCRLVFAIAEDVDKDVMLGMMKAIARQATFESESHRVLAQFLAHDMKEIMVDELKLLLDLLGMSWTNALDTFKKQILSRGDMLLLPALPLANVDSKVAWLRAIWQEKIAEIALKTSDADSRAGIRMAQLDSPFRYRLTQMLGSVFSDVGLPDFSQSELDAEFAALAR